MSYKKADYLLFALIFVAILFLSVFCLDNTCYWGDDFAAYISEGIAIAEGTFDRQVDLNALMHPSELPDEALNGELVYVWGYPLLMGLVYALVGFDRVGFISIIYYKLPSAVALALLAGVLFLFLRRRFGRALSFTAAFLFCACYEFRVFINTLYSDVVFLFFAMLSLFLLEVFLSEERRARKLTAGFLLGAALWFTYEVRLNGISILFACAVACAIRLFKQRPPRSKLTEYKKSVGIILLPFATFLILKLISEAVLAPATGNTSDLSGVTVQTVWNNLVSYYYSARAWLSLICDDALSNWLNRLLTAMTDSGTDSYGIIGRFCGAVSTTGVSMLLFAALIGVLSDGFTREVHLTLFAVIYLLVVCMLPYNQGVRYIYPVMLLIPLYVCHAFERLGSLITAHCAPCLMRAVQRGSAAVGVVMCALTLISGTLGILYARSHVEYIVPEGPQDFYSMYAYTPCSIETYNYIIGNTPEDCVIGFYKPRALYLNTERLSLRTDINGHSLDEVDYLLTCAGVGEEQLESCPGSFERIFSNIEFTLYKKLVD